MNLFLFKLDLIFAGSLINIFLGNLSLLEYQVITEAIPDIVGSKLIGLVTSRAEIPELLKVNTK